MNEKQEKAVIALNRLYSMNQIDKGEFLVLMELVMQPTRVQYVPYYYWNVPMQQQENPTIPPYEVTCTTNSQVADTTTPSTQLLNTKLVDLDLSLRTINVAQMNQIDTIGDVARLHRKDWLAFKNGGKKSMYELENMLNSHGLTWGMEFNN